MMKRCLDATWLTLIVYHIALLSPAFAGGVPCGPPSAEEVRDKLKGARIIIVQDYDKINPLDQWGWGEVNEPIKDYDRNYPTRLKESLGVEIVKVKSDELLVQMRKVDGEKAEKVADTWTSDATELKVVKKKDLVRNARLYLSLKELLSRHEGDVVTMATWHLSGSHNREGQKTNVMLPMSILEFGKEHIPCSCQCHLDCLVTMMVGTYLTGGCMGFDGDVLNDWSFKPTGARPKDVIVVGHCGAPINPHGNDRIPYLITDQTVRRVGWIPGCRIEIPEEKLIPALPIFASLLAGKNEPRSHPRR